MLYEKITYTLLAIKKLLFGKQKIDEKKLMLSVSFY